MIPVQFPEPRFRMKKEQGVNYIFDGIRKSWLLLTEEEWVRQNIVSYLTEVVHYPASVIALEKEITLHDLKKRFDILIYNRAIQPWKLIECKAPDVPLSEQVLQQVLRYNISVPVQFMLITNGENTIGWKKEGSSLTLLQQMPKYE